MQVPIDVIDTRSLQFPSQVHNSCIAPACGATTLDTPDERGWMLVAFVAETGILASVYAVSPSKICAEHSEWHSRLGLPSFLNTNTLVNPLPEVSNPCGNNGRAWRAVLFTLKWTGCSTGDNANKIEFISTATFSSLINHNWTSRIATANCCVMIPLHAKHSGFKRSPKVRIPTIFLRHYIQSGVSQICGARAFLFVTPSHANGKSLPVAIYNV